MDQLRRRQVFGPDGYPVAGAVLSVPDPVDSHTHDFLELAVLLDGTVGYQTVRGFRRLDAGAVTAVRPGEWHAYLDPDRAVIGNLYLGAELLHGELRWLLEIGDLGRFLLRGGVAEGCLEATGRQRVRRTLTELAGGTALPGTAAAISAVGSAYAVLGELARLSLDAGRRPGLSAPVRQMVMLLSRRPAETWTLAALAAQTGYSVSHLHREFRAQLGLTPMAWLATTRAELAASLLLQTERPVAWIGRQVGWPDPNYFSRCFRRAYGISPTAYRVRNAPSAELRSTDPLTLTRV